MTLSVVSLLRHAALRRLGLALLVGLTSQAFSHAQDVRAKLTVTVADPSGKAIPNAILQLRNMSNAEVFPGTTNEEGLYPFLFLSPGTYELTATSPGFKTAKRENIILQTFQASGIEIKLEVGGVSESVTVTAEAALLGTESASRGQVVSTQMVSDLPVANNNPMMLGQTLEGVYMRPLGAYTQPWTITSQFMINGGLMSLNEFQLDGAPNNQQLGSNTYGYSPPNEAVQEFSVQANSYDAQFGRTGGGVINVTTKSGTSQFHGEGWTYLQRTGWNANSFQNNAIGSQRAPGPLTQWGLQFSGPAYIPKIIPKNDKFQMFYLFSWDHYDELLPNPLTLSTPSPEMRAGDFSRLTNASGQPIAIYDPASGHVDASGNFVRDQFPGNMIPANRISPVSRAVAALMPLPNVNTRGVRYSTQNLLFPVNTHDWTFFNWLAKVDFNFGTKYRLFVRPAKMKFDEASNYNGIVGPGKQGGLFSRLNDALLVDGVATLSPTLIVNLRANFSRFVPIWQSPDNFGFDLTKIGLPSSLIPQLAQPALFGRWEYQQYLGLGQTLSANYTNTYSLQGSVTKFAKGHNLRAGGDLRRTHYLNYAPGNTFYFNSLSDWTRRVWNDANSEADSGDSFATFLLGTPSSGYAQNIAQPFFRSWYFAPWFQDDWKVTKRLTLNIGLRWDLNTPPDEKHNRLNVGFNTTATNPIGGMIPAAQLAQYPNFANLTGAIQFAGVNGNGTTAAAIYAKTFQPRFGMAYQVTPKLIFRGGYGIYYTNFESNNITQTLGFSSQTTLTTSNDGGQTPIPNLLSNPFPSGIAQPSGASLGALTYVGQSFSFWNPQYKLPHVHQFSAGFQFQVTPNSILDISYIGSRTVNAQSSLNINLPSWSYASQCDVAGGGSKSICDALAPNPFKGIAALQGTSLGSSATLSQFNLHRPYPEFGDITENGVNIGKVWYNALQINYNRRFSKGLTLITSYVRSRQIQQTGFTNQYLQTPQRGPYSFDHPNVFKLSAVYDLPFGKNRTFTLANNWILDTVLGGWQIAPSLFIQNGEPATLPANAIRLRNSDVSNINWNQNQVRGWGNCVLSKDVNGNVTPLAYSLKAGCSATDFSSYDWLLVPTLSGQQLSPNNSGDLRMKPFIDSNLAISKIFHVYEKGTIQFKAQATNALNHFNYLTARFNTNPTDSAFGTTFPAQTPGLDAPARVIQLGVKVLW